jgi:hypothetical protein
MLLHLAVVIHGVFYYKQVDGGGFPCIFLYLLGPVVEGVNGEEE